MKYIFPLICGILTGLVIYLSFIRPPKVVPVPVDHYKTDTVKIPVPFEVPKPYPVNVPPHIVKEYVRDSLALDSLKLLLSEKDILIQGLKKDILISQSFLKLYPSNPKILNLDLSRDSLSLSLLDINGLIRTNIYPVSFSNFRYRWTLEGLSKYPVKPISMKNPLEMFAGGGHNFLYHSPYLDLTVEKNWARMRLYSGIKVGLLDKNASSIDVGLKYRVK